MTASAICSASQRAALTHRGGDVLNRASQPPLTSTAGVATKLKHAEVLLDIRTSVRAADIYNQARVEAADKQGAAAAPASPRDRPLMNSLFSRMGTSWSARPTDAPPPPGDGPRAPPPPPPAAAPPARTTIYRPRDRSPDSVLEDVGAWARDDGSDARARRRRRRARRARRVPRRPPRAAATCAASSRTSRRRNFASPCPSTARSLVRSESLSACPPRRSTASGAVPTTTRASSTRSSAAAARWASRPRA